MRRGRQLLPVLGKKRKQTDESEGRGNQKKRESKKERGLTGFLREEGSRVFWKKKVRKSKKKKRTDQQSKKKKQRKRMGRGRPKIGESQRKEDDQKRGATEEIGRKTRGSKVKWGFLKVEGEEGRTRRRKEEKKNP